MRKWTTTAGLLFCAAASVYTSQAIAGRPAKSAKPADQNLPTDVKVLEESVDPFAPTTSPTSQPSDSTAQAGGPAAPLHMNEDGTFSLNIVSGADLVEQLRVIGFQAQMSVIPSKEVRGSLPAIDLYDVTAPEALDALLHPNGYAWRQKGNFVYVYSLKEIQEMEKSERVANTEIFRLYYTPAADAVTMIKPVMSADGQVAFNKQASSGIESGAKDVGGNSHATEDVLVVTDYAEHLDRIRAVIREIDRRPQQILIEATILRASLTEDNALGVDFNVVGGVDFDSFTSSDGQITDGELADTANGNQVHSVGSGTSFSRAVPPNSFRVGVVTNNVSVFLAALEGVTDTTVLANPKVLALNKQKGEVIVGRKDGYLTTTVTESTATQTVEFLDTGTRLIFRPYIGDDGYIRMEIHPEDSSGGLTADNLPFKFTTEVTSNVMVKDGHTVVIGGLFRESSDSAKSQVPFLGNIPLAGHLFKNQRDRTTREEVIILLTPHIVKDDSVYSKLSEEQMRTAEQMRVGVRRGMMPWGRERMADLYYQCALKELDKDRPDRKKAIFYLGAATYLNPKFTEAIQLKEDLTGREITTSDGSSIRSFVRRSMMVDLPSPATQPTAEVPTTQPLATTETTPATQPWASKTPTLTPTPATQPLRYTPPTTTTHPLGGFQPIAELGFDQFVPTSETDLEKGYSGFVEAQVADEAEVDELMNPSSPPAWVDADDVLVAPSTSPSFARKSVPSSQPSRVVKGPSTRPANAANNRPQRLNSLNDLFRKSGDENAKDETTVTEIPTEELDGGSPDEN
jgi:type IV pilus assembly protein PilQ